MKFTDGYWLLRDGVRASYPVHVHDVEQSPGVLTVHAPTHRVRSRGDLLKGPVLSVELSSPLPDVVRVRVTHFAGGVRRGPDFPLCEAISGATTEVGERSASLTSGALTATVGLDPFSLTFTSGGRLLTTSGTRSLALMDLEDGSSHLREQLELGVGTSVYGLGERFGPLVKNGQSVDIWNADGGTSSEQAYKNVPFYLTDAGYGVFVDSPGGVAFEVGSEAVSRVSFSLQAQELEYLVIEGATPKEVLRKYTALTGRPALPPAWSFGLWLSTSFTTDYDEQTVNGFLDGMRERELPLSVFHFDCFWMRALHWCDFEWDPAVFPDPKGMVERLHERGIKVSLWINPYIAQRSALFEEGRAACYLLKRTDGSVWQWDLWQPGMALVDFTNPDARAWYAGKLEGLLDIGVDCFKTDFGERVPTEDVAWFDGSDPERMHNFYAYLYNETVFDLLTKHRGQGEAVLFARSATAGTQQFPVHWGGDCESSWTSMAETLRGGLSLALSGFGFWSHDIGGFEGAPAPDLFKRWIAFGLLSSHSRLHGSGSYRVPWTVDEESVDVLRAFTDLKLRLMPYLYGAAVTAHETGTTVMRPMVLEFPDDPACSHLDRQYTLGPDLLVAPVLSPDGRVRYYVPEGTWTSVLTGAQVTGPRWVDEVHDVHSLPLLARPGSVVPVGASGDRPDYDYADGVTLHVHALADGDRVVTTVPTTTGEVAASFVTTRAGQTVEMSLTEGAARSWSALLTGVTSVDDVRGGTARPHPRGTLLQAAPGSTTMSAVQAAP